MALSLALACLLFLIVLGQLKPFFRGMENGNGNI